MYWLSVRMWQCSSNSPIGLVKNMGLEDLFLYRKPAKEPDSRTRTEAAAHAVPQTANDYVRGQRT